MTPKTSEVLSHISVASAVQQQSFITQQMKLIKVLSKDYKLFQTDFENWISFWIIDPHGEDVKSFASVQRAMDWWEVNKKEILEESETPEWRRARQEATKLVRRMGVSLDSLPKEEQEQFIRECL